MGHASRPFAAIVIFAPLAMGCVVPYAERSDDENGQEPLASSCALAITKNAYDGPNYWGTIAVSNTGLSAASGYAVEFDIPPGAHCTADTIPSGATLSPLTGAATTSNHCVFTWTGSTLAAGASKVLNYSTDSPSFSAASHVTVTAKCSGTGAPSGTTPTTGGAPSGGGSDGSGSSGTPAGTMGPCDFPASRIVDVNTSHALSSALSAAKPGDLIRLADGVYSGRFTVSHSGSASHPVVVCGSRKAVLDGGSTGSGYVVWLKADYVTLSGFSVENGMKGIMLDGASQNLLTDLEVSRIGNEGIHFRKMSSHNVLRRSYVHDCGLTSSHAGEGVYIGSSVGNWSQYTGGAPDKSDDNEVVDNRIGRTTAESIDIKEGTTGGTISGNIFDGTGMVAEAAVSWVNAKGNGYVIENNSGARTPEDGFRVNVVATGWGNDNVFRDNMASIEGSGYGFHVVKGSGNVVACDNRVNGGTLSNVRCR